jgi:hypothetical protein
MTLHAIERGLRVLALAMVCAALGIVLAYLPGWCRITTRTLLHLDEFAGEGRNAMKQVYAASLTSRDASQALLDRTREAQGTIAAATQAIGRIGALADQANATVLALDQRSAPVLTSAQDFLDRSQRTLDQVDGQVARAGPAFDAWGAAAGDLQAQLRNPAIGDIFTNSARVTNSWALASDDAQHKFHAWLYPPPTRRTKLGLLWHGLMLGRDLAIPGAQLGYYVSNTR